MATAATRLSTARSQLILRKGNGFWGSLALRLELVPTTAIPTLGTDGRKLVYNPGFIESLSDSLLYSAIAHEVMHCVLDHSGRLNGRDQRKWNYAADYAINPILEDSGFELGADWLYDKNFAGLSADEIYQQLPDDPAGKSFDELQFSDGEGGEGDDREMLAIEWKLAAIQAATAAKQAGALPASLERFLEQATAPVVNWRDQLRQFITQVSKNDYAWSRPNKRYLGAGIYLPSLYSESMGPIVIGVDTSGSIDDKTLQRFGAEIRAIAAATLPERIHVVYCDARVAHVDEYEGTDDMKFAAHGGGGTAFKPVFDYVEQQGIQPACLVYLTDLYGDHGFAAPGYPVMWASTTKLTASFGETIFIGD